MSNTLLKNSQWFDENVIDCDFIRENEIVQSRGKIHAPISSALILDKFHERANSLGLKLVNEKGALKKDGLRYMYVAEVEDNSHPDYALSVGFRNFGDKSLAFSGMCGNSIFVCQNGVCTSVVKPSKMRHTIGNVNTNGFLDNKIDNIFSRFLEDKDKIHEQISVMKSTRLTDDIVGKFVRRANGDWKTNRNGEKVFVKNPTLGSANLLRILTDLENPAYNSHEDNSVFRLMNSCSKVTSHDMKNPNQAMMASRFCNNLIMSIIKSDFIPLGDMLDNDESDIVEVELV